jgi:hypothetical protein
VIIEETYCDDCVDRIIAKQVEQIKSERDAFKALAEKYDNARVKYRGILAECAIAFGGMLDQRVLRGQDPTFDIDLMARLDAVLAEEAGNE